MDLEGEERLGKVSFSARPAHDLSPLASWKSIAPVAQPPTPGKQSHDDRKGCCR